MAKILLIYPQAEEYKNPRFGFSLNLLYLSSILKKNGHTVIDYIDLSLVKHSELEFNEKIKSSDYIIIELDSFSLKRSTNILSGEQLTKSIKNKFPNKKIIVFGYDISLYPRDVQYSDYTLPSTNFESKILSIISDEKVNFDYSHNFDRLPFPDRKILSFHIEHGGNLQHKPNLMKSTLIQTSHGCLNSCTFCQRKGWQSKYLSHSVDYVVSEFKNLKENDYVNIWIVDDNFTYNLKRAKAILSQLHNKNLTNKMKISCSSWTKIDKEFLTLAKNANISIISFGIESASDEILRFYDKDINLKHTSELIRFADEIGLYTVGNFIVGAPMETEKTIYKTFEYALNTPFDQVNIKILDYMIGSKLFNTLPKKFKKNRRHIFASKETGLNDFYLSDLKDEISKFKKEFNESRCNILKLKISKHGVPYINKI